MRLSPLLAIAVVAVSCTSTTGDPAAPPSTAPATTVDPYVPPDLPRPGTPIEATITRVLDGDSMEVSIGGQPDEVRILGINAPEGDECGGDLAKDFMEATLEGRDVVLYGSERDQFGRLLAFVEVDGSPVGWVAVRRGLVLALTVDHPRLAAYGQAEDDAFIDQIGMWAPDACGDDSGAIVGIADLVWDPPGRDSDNLNEEVVVLTSEDGPVNMSGWILRDESTRWRFEFPDGFVLSGEVTVHTGCGNDDADDLYWCANDPLWSNFGDTAIVLDDSGNVVARSSYGAKTER
jgi:endonuclease YncB( thermonuclease family)